MVWPVLQEWLLNLVDDATMTLETVKSWEQFLEMRGVLQALRCIASPDHGFVAEVKARMGEMEDDYGRRTEAGGG